MLEDQHRDKIGFVRVDEGGEIDVLSIQWDDDSRAGDFLQSIDDPGLRAAIVEMAGLIAGDG